MSQETEYIPEFEWPLTQNEYTGSSQHGYKGQDYTYDENDDEPNIDRSSSMVRGCNPRLLRGLHEPPCRSSFSPTHHLSLDSDWSPPSGAESKSFLASHAARAVQVVANIPRRLSRLAKIVHYGTGLLAIRIVKSAKSLPGIWKIDPQAGSGASHDGTSLLPLYESRNPPGLMESKDEPSTQEWKPASNLLDGVRSESATR